MATAEHTPGPWEIFDLHDETRLNVRGPNEEFVADCADGFYSDEAGEWVMAHESYPNALLITAAPDFLAAAILLMQAADEGDADKSMDAHDALRAAIAKATGAL